jgi:hypothetical protein
MTTEQLRHSLNLMHQTRGRLLAFARDNQLNYNLLVKFIGNPSRQIWHETAQQIIDALPSDLKCEVLKCEELEPQAAQDAA